MPGLPLVSINTGTLSAVLGSFHKAYRLGECYVVVGRESIDPDATILTKRWHLSISHPDRFPTWNEINEARDRLLPDDVFFCLPHPPKKYWLSVHPNCFHLWELHDHPLIEQMKYDAEGARELGFGGKQPERRS
jgi:hypothetical protein